jgi:hypothetical protein
VLAAVGMPASALSYEDSGSARCHGPAPRAAKAARGKMSAGLGSRFGYKWQVTLRVPKLVVNLGSSHRSIALLSEDHGR